MPLKLLQIFLFSLLIGAIPFFLTDKTLLCLCYDAFGYYIYLPAFLLYKDPFHLTFIKDIIWQYDNTHEFYQATILSNGNYVFGYTGGVALMQLPFFLTAHFFAKIFQLKADGFSSIYQYFIYVSGIFYGTLGLYNLYRIIRIYYTKTTAILTIVTLLFATNLCYYFFVENGMGHIYSFFLVSCLFFLYKKIVDGGGGSYAVLAGVCFGLLFLVRPSNGVILPFLLFSFTDFSLSAFRSRLSFLLQKYKQLGMAALISALPFLLQMLYWKSATGQFFFNPYSHLGLGFDFKHPHLFYGLFDTYRGLFFYAPILVFFVVGLFWFKQKNILSPIFVFIYFVVNSYIIYSWKVYDYGGSYGARAMVEHFVVLSFPLSSFLHFVLQKRIAKYLYLGLLSIAVMMNIFQINKFCHGWTSGYSHLEAKHSYFSTGAYYCSSPKSFKTKSLIASLSFDSNHILNQGNIFSPTIELSYDTLGDFSQKRIAIVAAGAYRNLNILNGKRGAQLISVLEHNGEIYNWKGESFFASTPEGDTALNFVSVCQKTPTPLTKNDKIKFFVWNPGKNDFAIRHIKAELIQL